MNRNIKQNSSKLFYEGACGSCSLRSNGKLKESIAPSPSEWLSSLAGLKNFVAGFTPPPDKWLSNLVELKSGLRTTALGVMSSLPLLLPAPVIAQEAGATEEVVVTGIVGSLTQSADIKRNARGVVDAITAEDIGKFPDTNLAESLQRISGVSIDRSNNEGSRVTVRGLGPEYNLVTLNGRQIATSALDFDGRSFDFANIASEGVSGVEVYKTFQADQPSGGIGSLINIKTLRPLDNPGLTFSIGGKGVMDTSVEKGNDITPEISAIFSNTYANDTFGVGASFSRQERDSRSYRADIASWHLNNEDKPLFTIPIAACTTTPPGAGCHQLSGPDSVVNPAGNAGNGASIADNTWHARNFGYQAEDIERTRINGELVFQWAPTDTFKATADYVYSSFENNAFTQGVGFWFDDSGGRITEAVLNENGTYVYLKDEGGNAYSATQTSNMSENVNKSIGFNFEWQALDNLNLVFDISDSDAVSRGLGRGNNAYFILETAGAVGAQAVDLRAGKVPSVNITWNDAYTGRNPTTGEPTAGSYDSLFGQAIADTRESEIFQLQFDGVWENTEDEGLLAALEKIQFGADRTVYTYSREQRDSQQQPAGWFGGNHDLYPDAIFSKEPLENIDDFSGGGGNVGFYYDWDYEPGVIAFEQGIKDGIGAFGAHGVTKLSAFDPKAIVTESYDIEEITYAPYIQLSFDTEVLGAPISLVAGMRYEKTEITSTNTQLVPKTVEWSAPTADEVNVINSDDKENVKKTDDYNVFLPNLDLSAEFIENVISRFSYSQSITRPQLAQLRATTSLGGVREGTADAGNPSLQPYSADNLDLSLEWYYDESSYMSVGYYRKDVSDFIITKIVDQPLFGLRDPRLGGDYAQAVTNLGGSPTGPEIFAEINRIRGRAANTPVEARANNDLISWRVSQPINVEKLSVDGWEFAIQHVFWESGFGIFANATLSNGDSNVNPAIVDTQFALEGLSDSYNLVGFYEKYGFQARVAYNWRDEFLSDAGAVVYTEKFGQLDFNVGYEFQPNVFGGALAGLSIFIEGLNVTGEATRTYHRYSEQLRTATRFEPRYNIGLRYNFF